MLSSVILLVNRMLMNQIDRREALKRLSLIVGGTLSASTVSAFLSGCGSGGGGDGFVFETLTPDQQELVTAIADVIIPATDTPGARDVGVDQFIDQMLSGWMKPPEKERFLDGLSTFESSFQTDNGKAFVHASSSDQLAYMEPRDVAAVTARREGRRPLPFFGVMKELVVTGYYTSEIGASQELRHQMIFAKYDGNVELQPGGRAWSNDGS